MLGDHPCDIRVTAVNCMFMQEVEVKIASMSELIHLERPFQMVVKLQSHVDRQLGPLTLTMASGNPNIAVLITSSHKDHTVACQIPV